MKKKSKRDSILKRIGFKPSLIMNTIIPILLVGILQASPLSVQKSSINMQFSTLSLEKVIWNLKEQTGFTFIYSTEDIQNIQVSDMNVQDATLEAVLNKCLKSSGLNYSISHEAVIIMKAEEIQADMEAVLNIKGKITDKDGNPLPGTTVLIKGTLKGTTTDADGNYSIEALDNAVLVFTFIGYQKQEIAVDKRTEINVVMEEAVSEIEEVVITGIVTRKAESFTGAAITVKKEELLRAGNQNILQSLKNIDPSFMVLESNIMGSNPNTLPEIVLRGRSNLPDLTGTYSGNPNQPLFILDGFETSLQTIYDLDMNRIKYITILKDATAKAIYGSKAGNGVVVIETEQPKKGKLRVSYMGNFDVESPDLTGYNLMDAKEKLQWEHDHGMYASGNTSWANDLETLYNKRYQNVHIKGVDTYWLSQPLQTGFGQKHSLFLEGGDESMRYGATFSYNGITGVMKGSDRETFSGSTTLSYRYKNLIFRNQIEFSQNTANNSPYGDFSDYTALNPYYALDSEGNHRKILDDVDLLTGLWSPNYNPLYNASLNIIDQSKYTQITDNFYMEWNIRENLKFTGSLGYTYQKNNSDYFLPPSHTDFISYTEENGLINYSGKWTQTYGTNQMLSGKLGLNYTYSKGKHFLLTNVTLDMSDNKSKTNTFVGEGFGSDNVTDISMATYYQRGSSPAGMDSHIRNIGVLGMLNYSYNDRYLLDLTYRTDASSIYGANARWGSFWSVGTGWNMHNEEFIKNLGFIQQFKLRGSIGYTGTQTGNSYMTLATYNYGSVVYTGRKGATLFAFPNPNLKWQKNIDYNLGFDLIVLDNKLSARFELYKKVTTNLLQNVTAPPSFGFDTYRENLGKTVNTGYEIALRYQVFNDKEKNAYLNLAVTATHNKNILKDISDAFSAYNNQQDEAVSDNSSYDQYDELLQKFSKPVARYYEGQSITAIWAMQSLGIDPSSGNELFLDKNGVRTYTWSSSDLIIAGDTEPALSGTFSVNAGYKSFTLGLTCSYKFGGQLYNSTLVSKVENINAFSNVDRRVKDMWTRPGDVAIYKAPDVSGYVSRNRYYTQSTTRFVQDNNELYFSTINLGYEVRDRKFLEKLGFERLKVTFYTNELLRISTIKTERGTSYPYARNFSFSLQATF